MKYYKDSSNEIYAYDDNVSKEALAASVEKFSLTPLTQKEIEEYLTPKIDERAKALAQLEADIKECEDDIKHALIIGNTAVLESLRNEYKELIIQREGLK
ncbi:hypothetical protein [Campylobacter concisus]|uniref:Uncharacterized protein n=1 Tax=Campylobacter concisus ATCC 51562 TaxID=1242969 RepID=U2ERX0_9BACT|nr:hypothetical protein [Campylobacter concisus]ERJ26856.1 hypothetical protein ATCC51562_1014 [Campylobacter concisus ATCC 51562]